MRRVIVESPYAGNVDVNIAYARAALAESLDRGEAPLASHLLYPQVLDDDAPNERSLGIEAGLVWASQAELSAFYIDRGWSSGMKAALDRCIDEGREFETRRLGDEWADVELTAAQALAIGRAI